MQSSRGEIRRHRRPFWLPAVNYYVMILALAAVVFMLILLALGEAGDKAYFGLFSAGIGAGLVLLLGVVVREIIIRNAQEKYLTARRHIDRNIRWSSRAGQAYTIGEGKLTLERNAAILREIAKKSSAAKVLGKFPQGHKEVFELCEKYIAAVDEELPRVGVGSPRIAALRKGCKAAGEYHHYHLLQFTELEAKSLAQEASGHVNIFDRLNTAQRALNVVDLALTQYPHEQSLKDSHRVLSELIVSIEASGLVEQAEKSFAEGSYRQAIILYEDALDKLLRSEFRSGEHAEAAHKIEQEIERLTALLRNA